MASTEITLTLTPAEQAEARRAIATDVAHERMVDALKQEYGPWTQEHGWKLLEARLTLDALLDAGAGE